MAAEPEFLLRLYSESGLLLLPEEQLPQWAARVREQATGSSLGEEIDDVIAAILLSRFNGRSVSEICAMGGITVEDFTSSVAYKEIFGLGRQEGRDQGRQAEAAALTLRLLQRRCGPLSAGDQAPSSSCRWRSWRPWPMPFPTSRAAMT